MDWMDLLAGGAALQIGALASAVVAVVAGVGFLIRAEELETGQVRATADRRTEL